MMKGIRVIGMVISIVGVALFFMPAAADDGTVTNYSEIGKLRLRSADESAGIPAGAMTSNGDTIETGGGEIRIGTGEGGREAGGAPDSAQRINVQTGKHGRDASANANATVHVVAPATATPEDAADEQTIRNKGQREIETSRREMQEEQRREREAAEPDD